MTEQQLFQEILTQAVTDTVTNGYDSPERIAYWVSRLRAAALREQKPDHVLMEELSRSLGAIYRAKVERGTIDKLHPGVPQFTIERIAPRLRPELGRRIFAAADLIKNNKPEAVRKTLRRFTAWATSIPPGGTDAVNRVEVKKEIRKPLQQASFQERRVAVDQGQKLVANISEIIAQDGGAIAGMWRSHYRQANYNYREDHKERDGKVYMIRDNWAQERGLVKVGAAGYVDEITRPAEEVFCQCYYVWIHGLRRLPASMLTEKGRAELDRVRSAA